MAAQLASGFIRPALLVLVTFVTGPVYVWSGKGNITWNGHTWVGVGNLGTISTSEEGTSVQAKGITLSLSGIDSGLIADVAQEFAVKLPAQVFMGLLDDSLNLIADPLNVWTGYTDKPKMGIGGETSTISITCENKLISMNVACDRRYTQDDAQIDHPGDTGFNFVSSITELAIYWGRVPSVNTNL